LALVEAEEAGDDESRSGTEVPATTNPGVPMTKKTTPDEGGDATRGRRQQPQQSVDQSRKRLIEEKRLQALCASRKYFWFCIYYAINITLVFICDD
jgi:hypothetical protein